MSSGLQSNNPLIVGEFHSVLIRRSLVVLTVFLLLAVAWYAHARRPLAHLLERDGVSSGIATVEAPNPPADPERLRNTLTLRRSTPSSIVKALWPPLSGHPARYLEFPKLGSTPCQLGSWTVSRA